MKDGQLEPNEAWNALVHASEFTMPPILAPGDYFGASDPLFYVVSGRLLIELEERTVDLQPGNAFVVPKGVRHRPRAPVKTVMLMVEGAGIVPTGDA